MRPTVRFAAPVLAALACAVGAATVTGCGGGSERSATAFCNRLDKDLPGLEGPTETQDDLDHLVARYDSLAGVAPLAIQDDWDQLTELIHTAVSVVPTDAESVQKVIDATYATERAARRVETWVTSTCGLTMPVVLGLEGTTTTVAPETTPAP